MLMNYRNILLVISGIAILVVATLLLYSWSEKNKNVATNDVATNIVPKRTDFGAKAPNDFPTDIPVEEGVNLKQSYSLNYVGQKQLTIVFLSTKTVKENYALYTGFFEKQQWNISNKYESEKLSSIYGTKESNDINVTISYDSDVDSAKSQVSISVLRK